METFKYKVKYKVKYKTVGLMDRQLVVEAVSQSRAKCAALDIIRDKKLAYNHGVPMQVEQIKRNF